jgi:hypothetical protein
MSVQFTETEIELQRNKVFSGNPSIELVSPCRVGEGILKLDEEEKEGLIKVFNGSRAPISFFIPASGSGSRMFEFLYEFLEEPNEENRALVERFLNSAEEFAFFGQLPGDVKKGILERNMDLEEVVSYLLNDHGLGFGNLPKGLIPFHACQPFILNPFQEHILQGGQMTEADFSFHFTVQSDYESRIRRGIDHIEGMTGSSYKVEFSEQRAETNSVAFLENGEICRNEEGNLVTRPAGHGALLENLNSLNEELVFIKNIDNIQHINHSAISIRTWKVLGGLLLEFKTAARSVYDNPSIEGLISLNERFQVYSTSEIEKCTSAEDIRNLLDRPTRVCGMVKNQGQPGGGPFWVREDGVISKQIVEKAQVSNNGEQYKILVQSTHFNPVMIAASPVSLAGKKFDLKKYRDDSKYFIVHKTHKGEQIRYMEQPGLWNGSMANWNTLFVEVPSSTFSPVKTVLDLLDESHKA